MTNTIWMLLGVVILLVGLAVLRKRLELVERRPRGGEDDDRPWPFEVRREVMTRPEQVLYFRLRDALPDHLVLAQVQVSRVLQVRKGVNHQAWHNRISQLSYDFLICTRSAEPILTIELDDSSHRRAHRQKTDAKKDRATRDAGLRIIRWETRELPDSSTIRAAIEQPVPPVRTAADWSKPGS